MSFSATAASSLFLSSLSSLCFELPFYPPQIFSQASLLLSLPPFRFLLLFLSILLCLLQKPHIFCIKISFFVCYLSSLLTESFFLHVSFYTLLISFLNTINLSKLQAALALQKANIHPTQVNFRNAKRMGHTLTGKDII